MSCDLTIVVYRPRWPELKATLASLALVRSEFRQLHILVSGDIAAETSLKNLIVLLDLSEQTTIYQRFDNLGFAGGQNFLMSRAFAAGANWALVYNPDLEVRERALAEFLIRCQRAGPDSLYGPWIFATGMLPDQRLDSRGIKWNSSSRHFDINEFPLDDSEEFAKVEGLTGACLLVSRQVYEFIVDLDGEFFDHAFVAYREDAELGVRAGAYGISSYSVRQIGISHERGVPSASRKNTLVNLLSVQNRFLMRWKLKKLRPGTSVLPTLRDLLVVLACLTRERSSLPGLYGAFRIRRYARYKGAGLRDRQFLAQAREKYRLASAASASFENLGVPHE